MNQIYIEPEDWIIIQAILKKTPYLIYAYGSRTKGTHQRFSDLDLCIMEDISDSDLSILHEAFEESDLPFKVDIIKRSSMSEDFFNHIRNDLLPINTKQIQHDAQPVNC